MILAISCVIDTAIFIWDCYPHFDSLLYVRLVDWVIIVARVLGVYVCLAIGRKIYSAVRIDSKMVIAFQLLSGILVAIMALPIWTYVQYSEFPDALSLWVAKTFAVALISIALVFRITPLAKFPIAKFPIGYGWFIVASVTMLLILGSTAILDTLGIERVPPEIIFFGLLVCIGFALLARYSPATAVFVLSGTVQVFIFAIQALALFCTFIFAIVGGMMNRR